MDVKLQRANHSATMGRTIEGSIKFIPGYNLRGNWYKRRHMNYL